MLGVPVGPIGAGVVGESVGVRVLEHGFELDHCRVSRQVVSSQKYPSTAGVHFFPASEPAQAMLSPYWITWQVHVGALVGVPDVGAGVIKTQGDTGSQAKVPSGCDVQ